MEEKRVRFDESKNKVHNMHCWIFAYRQSRTGAWETAARDRFRFEKRVRELEDKLTIVTHTENRSRVYKERFCENEEI